MRLLGKHLPALIGADAANDARDELEVSAAEPIGSASAPANGVSWSKTSVTLSRNVPRIPNGRVGGTIGMANWPIADTRGISGLSMKATAQ